MMNEPPSMITSLPDDVVLDILARVPRYNYPTLSLVCKHFQSLVASPEIYARRSLLRCTESYLYVLLFSTRTLNDRWHVLSQKASGNRRFALISSLLDMPCCESFVAVGSRIYMFGANGIDKMTSSSAFMIDCIYHTVQPLPNMPIPMRGTAAAFFDDKIYVVGHCSMKSTVMVVFNTRTQMWEPGSIKPDTSLETWNFGFMVVMADKVYMKSNYVNSFIYVPKESKWETVDEMMNSKQWTNNPCVVDGILYYYDGYHVQNCLRVYDSKQKCWGVVNGLEELMAEIQRPHRSNTVRFGRNLALYFCKREEQQGNRTTSNIWCAEISLERRQGGEIWGKVEWCDQVIVAEDWEFTLSVSVMV